MFGNKNKNNANRQSRSSNRSSSPVKLKEGQVLEGTVINVADYGIFVDVGTDSGLVHSKDITGQYLTKEDVAIRFQNGQKVKVIVLGYNDQGKLQLGIKQLHGRKLQIGEDIEVRCVDVNGYNLVAIATDGSYLNCVIPSYELPQKHGVPLYHYIGTTMTVKITKIKDRDIFCSLIQNLWQTAKISEGDVIRVCVDSYIDEGVRITTVNEGLPGIVFRNEITWLKSDKDIKETDYPKMGEEVDVKVKKFDANNRKLQCSLRDLQPNPWMTADLHEGDVIDVMIVNHDNGGLKCVTNREKLPGRIYRNQITWFVADDNITESDCPKIGSTVKAKVTKFDPVKRKLNFSLRELTPNPWFDMAVGATFNGAVTSGHFGDYQVRLDNGINCQCCDTATLPKGEDRQFIVVEVDPTNRKAEVSHQMIENTRNAATIIETFFSHRGQRHHAFIRGNAILLPQNILYDGEPVSMPFAMACIDFLCEHPERLGDTESVGESPVFISIDMRDIGFRLSPLEPDAIKNSTVAARLVVPTADGAIVEATGHFGHIAKQDLSQDPSATQMSVRFLRFGATGQLDRMTTPRSAALPNGDASKTGNLFNLTDEELAVLPDTDRVLIEALVADCPNADKDNVEKVEEQIEIGFDHLHTSQLQSFLVADPDYFTTNNFWLTTWNNIKGDQFIAIFDEHDVLLQCVVTDNGFSVVKFYHDRLSQEVKDKYRKSAKALFLPAGLLHLHKKYDVPTDYDAAHVWLTLSRRQDIYDRVVKSLGKMVKTGRRAIAKDYITMQKFLEFQQNTEKKRLEGLELTISPSDIRLGSKEGTLSAQGAGLILTNPQCEKFFGEDSDEQSVKVPIEGKQKCLFAMLSHGDFPGEYFLSFSHTPDLNAYNANGIKIEPNANDYHLRIQQKSVGQFIDKGDLLSRLERGQLRQPVAEEGLTFFDQKFNHVEPGNNQPLAIREAVGNQDMFLIQGPPGTGKTSVIVEIIRQLVSRDERVLVCSQAHSAVRNIYDRLRLAAPEINIGFIDEKDTMRPLSSIDHQLFLQHNMQLLDELRQGHNEHALQMCDEFEPEYDKSFRKDFTAKHKYMVKYYHDNIKNAVDAATLVENFEEEIERQSESDNNFYAACHVSSMQVVMGTCIGIGTNSSISRSGSRFDTLIIDEAGKANLAETIVPMMLAKKYVLVGDDNQLPPYTDTEEVEKFKGSVEGQDVDSDRVEDSLSLSLFEYFLHHQNLPKGCSVLLNYQYRMNPSIGNKISSLFYNGELNNGSGTELQNCQMADFPDAVTFFDTGSSDSLKRYNPYEQNSGNGNIYNPAEVKIIVEQILPQLESMKQLDSHLSIGIIAPYSEQVRRIRKALREAHSTLTDCVYTVDNVQGQEYDIVVLSFVRAFKSGLGRKVGFLDNLRRLNVALSRAKKKLIMVGNLATLKRPNAHRYYAGSQKLQPVEVFSRISADARVRHPELNSLDKLKKHGIKPGYVLKDCRIAYKYDKAHYKTVCYFKAKLGDDIVQFALAPNLGLSDGTTCDVRFDTYTLKGTDRPSFSVADPVIVEHDDHSGIVRLADGSEMEVEFNTKYFLFAQMLKGDLRGKALPLYFNGNCASLNYGEYKKRHQKQQNNYKRNNKRYDRY